MVTRRQFLLRGGVAGAAWAFSSRLKLMRALAAPLIPGLSDPAAQPKFFNAVPDALAPGFKYRGRNQKYRVAVAPALHWSGLVNGDGVPVPTPVFGYGQRGVFTWPGKTFEVQSGVPIEVMWQNKLWEDDDDPLPHVLTGLNGQSVVDTSLHWAYSLMGYEDYSIEDDGVPIVTHLHGGHTRAIFDGNPEYFFSPGYGVRGPRWVSKKYIYHNDQPAGHLWYHDHGLGITRLNVYAGMAGFYFVRDAEDTGKPDNPLGLPAWPYEKAYAIQDRTFKENGELFYPAFEGDPFWDDFITDEGAEPPFPGGPSALAEFFGDHMVVNGVIWPKEEVEPRHYRLRLLNGTDSRFMVLRFRPVPAGATDLGEAGAPLPFTVIGSDQGLAAEATETDILVFEPGGRYDVVFDFAQVPFGMRVILENLGGDAPFGGAFGDDLDPDDFFPDRQTDRVMAFDVVVPVSPVPDLFDAGVIDHYGGTPGEVTRTRKVALFEGKDEYGRLQPLLGTAEPASDYLGDPVIDPNTGQPFEGAIAWHSPTTENPAFGATEIWEIYNATGDAHPVHLHLVNFEILDRREFEADIIEQPVYQHNGEEGLGFRLENIELAEEPFVPPPGYVENAPKDMVTALPTQREDEPPEGRVYGQMTRIKMTYDRPGRYVWHCHILSHEDHEMMRVLHVGSGA